MPGDCRAYCFPTETQAFIPCVQAPQSLSHSAGCSSPSELPMEQGLPWSPVTPSTFHPLPTFPVGTHRRCMVKSLRVGANSLLSVAPGRDYPLPTVHAQPLVVYYKVSLDSWVLVNCPASRLPVHVQLKLLFHPILLKNRGCFSLISGNLFVLLLQLFGEHRHTHKNDF